jgi:hypothetical protein
MLPLPFVFTEKNIVRMLTSFMLATFPTHLILLDLTTNNIWWEVQTIAPHYAVFSTLPLSWVQIFSSTLHFQTPSVYFLWDTKSGFSFLESFTVTDCYPFVKTPCLSTTPCRLSASVYSIYSLLPSIYGGISIRNLWRAMPWWQGKHLIRNCYKHEAN